MLKNFFFFLLMPLFFMLFGVDEAGTWGAAPAPTDPEPANSDDNNVEINTPESLRNKATLLRDQADVLDAQAQLLEDQAQF